MVMSQSSGFNAVLKHVEDENGMYGDVTLLALYDRYMIEYDDGVSTMASLS